ncbi:MAG: ABC transporter ATP-binding protein, partial [Oscillospiraceae bacterium]|nr:ABC transporter ATP-binding protein [Oscillospiraceae bacterium]
MGKKNVWLQMLAYFKTALPLLALSMFLAIVISIADLVNPYITKVVIDEYIGKKNAQLNIYMLGGLYLFFVVLGAVLQYVQVNILNYTGQKIIHLIRMQVFSHIQKMSLKFFDTNSTGSILTRATNDIEAISELYSGVIIDLFKDVFMIAGIMGAMLLMNVRIALLNFCIIPLIVVITFLFNKKAKANFRWVRSLIARINAFFAENISGMKLVQIFNKQGEKYGEYSEINDEYNKAAVTQVRLNAIFRPSSEFVNSLAISILIWFCAGDIFGGALEFGVLFAFITYSKKFFAPINDLADKFTTIQSGRVSAERIFEL